ncbi:MAG: DUF4369 domain-containing protein [Candidatus Azobacteroides sp.]|nr:DUF4369 domain-containing protein [Candidatus Azobacteroides sp.]
MKENNLSSDWEKIDSTIILNENFEFKIQNDSLDILSLYFPDFREVLFVPETGIINIKINDSQSHISGTSLNDSLQQFLSILENYYIEKQKIQDSLLLFPEEQKIIKQQQINKINQNTNRYIFSFIKKNIQNSLGEYLFKKHLAYFDVMEQEKIINSSSPDFKSLPEIQNVINQIEEFKKLYGTFYKDIKIQDSSNKENNLSTYIDRKKITLLFFWAPWSDISKEIISETLVQYEEESDNITFIAIATDTDKKLWSENTKKFDSNLIQLIDNKKEGIKAYPVNSLPVCILIDKRGNIAAINLMRDNLQKKIYNLLEKE